MQRDRVQGHRVASGVGLAIGVVAVVAGGFLFAHATDVRSRESSADDEAGLGALLGGTLLLLGGSGLTIGSGVVLAVSNHEHAAIDERIRRLEADAKYVLDRDHGRDGGLASSRILRFDSRTNLRWSRRAIGLPSRANQ